jgi:hypothetical protein
MIISLLVFLKYSSLLLLSNYYLPISSSTVTTKLDYIQSHNQLCHYLYFIQPHDYLCHDIYISYLSYYHYYCNPQLVI